MRKMVVVGIVAVLPGGCGPHRITAAMRAKERQQQVEQARRDARQHAAESAKDRRVKLEKWMKDQVEDKQPLPPGIVQIGSTHFLADRAHAYELRHVCQDGPHTDYDHSGNDVDHVNFLSGGQISVVCTGPQFRWRDVAFERQLLAGKVHQPADGQPVTPDSKIVVEK